MKIYVVGFLGLFIFALSGCSLQGSESVENYSVAECEDIGGTAIANNGTESAVCPQGSENLGFVDGFFEGGICCSQ